MKHAVEMIPVNDIFIVGSRRPVSDVAVTALATSINGIGLQTPITIREDETIPDPDTGEVMGAFALVAGAHRLAACRQLGWDNIPAIVMSGDEIDAEMWEISENLHRADLSKDERDRCIRRFAELIEKREARESENQVVQNEPPEIGYKKPPPQSKGIAQKVADETGVSKSTVRRALNPPAPKPVKLADDALNDFEAKERQVSALMSAWNRAGLQAREEFLSRIDRPVMDGRFG